MGNTGHGQEKYIKKRKESREREGKESKSGERKLENKDRVKE